jgi:hypothetical protein
LATLAGEDKYPAANFEPKVVFVDQAAVAASKASKASSASSVATPCPAMGATAKKIEAPLEKVDPKYPAASFNPKVIYP